MVKCQMARMELQSCHHCRHLLYFSVCVCVRRPLEFYDLVSFSFSCFICLVFCASVVIFVFPFFFFFFFFFFCVAEQKRVVHDSLFLSLSLSLMCIALNSSTTCRSSISFSFSWLDLTWPCPGLAGWLSICSS